MSRVVLVEAQPRRAADAVPVTVRLAGGGSRAFDQFGHPDWRSGIADIPRFAAELGYDETGWTGGALPTTGGVAFWPTTPAAREALAALYWIDAPVTVRIGDDAAGDGYPVALVGKVASAPWTGGALTLTLTDLSATLAVALAPDTFAGTGAVEGDAEVAGRAKRRSFGRVWNVEARLLSNAYSIFEVGDPARPLQAIDAVRDQGRAASEVRSLAWQGSIAATLSALAGVVVPPGGAVVAPSIACVRWWTTPALLTVDLRGEIGAGYVETAPEIAARLAAIGAIAVDDVATFAGLRPAAAGIHVGAGTETIAQALDRLLFDVSLMWALEPTGSIRLGEISLDAAPVAALRSIEVTRETVYRPLVTRRLGYQRNERVQGPGEILAVVLDGAYADGTPYEDLKPAEAGADVTANNTAANTAYVGPKPVDIFLEDVASNLRSTLQQVGRLDLLDQFVNEIAYSSGQRIDIKVAELAARQTTDTGAYDVQLSKVAVFSADGTTARLSDALLYSNANGDQVYVAQDLRTLFASTAEHNAQIQNIQKIVLTPNGQFAKIAMLADVDGTVVGFEGTTDGVKSNFRIKTNDFRLVDDQNTVTMNPFSYVDQRFYLDDVYIRLLEVGSVKTESMALFAAGNTLGFRSTTIVNGSGSAPSSAFNILINANISMVRAGKITVLAYVNHAYTASADYGLDVVVDNGAAGGANEAGGAGAYTNGVNTNDSFDLTMGAHNLKLRWRGSSGIRVELASLTVLISY